MNYKNIFFVALIFLFTSCAKDATGDMEIGETPTIELLAVTPSSGEVQQYTDELIFTIKYYDGDGDLGTENPDIPTIELTDMRDPGILVFEDHLSPRTPSGSEITITGEVEVVLDHTILIDENNESEKTTFKIRIRDRAGNWSNEVETNEVTVLK